MTPIEKARQALDKPETFKEAAHRIVYEAVIRALKIAQPKLPEAGATPIALSAAIRASSALAGIEQAGWQPRAISVATKALGFYASGRHDGGEIASEALRLIALPAPQPEEGQP